MAEGRDSAGRVGLDFSAMKWVEGRKWKGAWDGEKEGLGEKGARWMVICLVTRMSLEGSGDL
jgi:hypothetical protein